MSHARPSEAALAPKPTDQEAAAFLQRWIDRLPPKAAGAVRWLLRPSMRVPRIVVALLLIVASLFWFLPVLGLWMLPLGLLLLAEDIPPLRRRLVHLLMRFERWWETRGK